MDSDPAIDKAPPSPDEVRGCGKIEGWKADGTAYINMKLLKAGGKVMSFGLLAILTASWLNVLLFLLTGKVDW